MGVGPVDGVARLAVHALVHDIEGASDAIEHGSRAEAFGLSDSAEADSIDQTVNPALAARVELAVGGRDAGLVRGGVASVLVVELLESGHPDNDNRASGSGGVR